MDINTLAREAKSANHFAELLVEHYPHMSDGLMRHYVRRFVDVFGETKPTEDGYITAMFGIATAVIVPLMLGLLISWPAAFLAGIGEFGVLSACVGLDAWDMERKSKKARREAMMVA